MKKTLQEENLVFSLYGSLPEEIAQRFSPEKPYRGRQIFTQLQARGADYASMTDIPEALRETLQTRIPLYSARALETLRDPDGTLKLRVGLADGAAVECVLLENEAGRRTACLSTQAGCAMGCAFCKTGTLGFKR
ncbi:MAG: 23S rRNA (adenine(2503)-C2)-methyltransferase, partial [Spirochaetales bacterium]|nr:23S rRNA (adenine(2503)-C2)-methyltransferase [Spirochaetales bacterium]